MQQTKQMIETDSDLHHQMISWRHWLHQHPELCFEEILSSDYIASVLETHDIEMHRGLAKTGIVATVKGTKTGDSIGLRADIDGLPIQELNKFDHKSRHDGKMHACGHDGHTTMLLGAAVYLKQHNNFSGTVHFIFQPAEEGDGGGRVMVKGISIDQTVHLRAFTYSYSRRIMKRMLIAFTNDTTTKMST